MGRPTSRRMVSRNAPHRCAPIGPDRVYWPAQRRISGARLIDFQLQGLNFYLTYLSGRTHCPSRLTLLSSQILINTKATRFGTETPFRMTKPLKEPQHGESSSRRGSWSKAFRDFYADEAKAVGMPVDQFLDMVGDRLEKRGQRPKEFRREFIVRRWPSCSGSPSQWLEQ
jgi:hypothetical protein